MDNGKIDLMTVLVTISLFAPTSFASTDLLEEEQVPIVSNGTLAAECGFAPAVVFMTGSGKVWTGTLIHPQIVLYAGHCPPEKVSQVEFRNRPGNAHYEAVDYCRTVPGYQLENHDFGYCKLSKPYYDIPPIPIAYGCELDKYVRISQLVTQCGFGAFDLNDTRDGQKRFAEGKITDLRTWIQTGPYNGVNGCPGDSGGPLLIRLDDGSWRTLGVLSSSSMVCGEGGWNRYSRIERVIEWLEEDSGMDVTPCFDRPGIWNPTEDCKAFWAGDNEQHGTWSNGCEGSPRSGYSDSCGDPYSSADTDTDSDSDTDSDDDSDTDTETASDTDTQTHASDGDADDDGNGDCGCAVVGNGTIDNSFAQVLLRAMF